ncbi:MAG: hypothetical protein HFE34_05555 [Clostridia bacterium]|nr:hypothetical protein [Clostridia bacterium]
MKNTMKKSSILAICISLAIVLFAVLLVVGIPSISSSDSGFDINTLSSTTEANSPDTNLLSDNYNFDKDAYIMESEFAACTLAALIFKNKGNVYTVSEMEPGSCSHIFADNLRQSYYNNLLKAKYGIEANGTCSLIAMIIASDALGINDKIDLSWANCKTEEDRNVAMLKELYDIAIKYGGNDYNVNSPRGTYPDTFSTIISEFYSNHGYNINVNDKTLKNDLRKNVEASRHEPNLLFIYNIYSQVYGDMDGGHTVVLLGSYKIRLKYKNSVLLPSHWGTFNAFIICDGWNNSSDGEIGENYQILIFNTNVKESVYLFDLLR